MRGNVIYSIDYLVNIVDERQLGVELIDFVSCGLLGIHLDSLVLKDFYTARELFEFIKDLNKDWPLDVEYIPYLNLYPSLMEFCTFMNLIGNETHETTNVEMEL